LVVLSGCAHAGIVNTVNHARQFTGIDRVHAVLGGFHLATSSDEDVDRTIDYLRTLGVSLLAPSHCTGFRAASRIAQQMPDVFVESVVGATYLL
jgi:7,8-dihydropterin-6-yl-methyl-4-(beta-D-ribofuranosyl)aminobenzene 5'-phosphate synthase